MVVDASVWVSWLIPADAHDVAGRRWLDEQVGHNVALVIPTLALVEVAGAVARRTGVVDLGLQAAEELRLVPHLRVVSLDLEFGGFAAQIAAGLRLRGADAVYVATARSLDLPLVTWDGEIVDRV